MTRLLWHLGALPNVVVVMLSATSAYAQATHASATAAPVIAEAQADWVTVTLHTSDPRPSLYVREPARLVMVGSEPSDAWEFICKAPCGKKVDPRRVYRVMGEELEPSKDFNLAPGSGAVSLDVDPHRRSTRSAGTIVEYVGLASLAVGTIVLLAGVVEDDAVDSVKGALGPAANVQSSAGTYEQIGVAMLVTGVVLETVAIAIFMTRTTELKPAATASSTRTSPTTGLRPIPWGVAF